MPIEYPDIAAPQTPREWFPWPNQAAITKGWERTITWMVEHPMIVAFHGFMPMAGQAPMKIEGKSFQRTKQQRVVCLGSPAKPFDGTYDLELDHDGCNKCRSIKLPDGSCLHDQQWEMDNFGKVIEWRAVFPVYCWEDQLHYIISEPMFRLPIKRLLAERGSHEESPTSYAVKMVGKVENKANDIDTFKVDPPGPVPDVDPDDERISKIISMAHPIWTPQKIVDWLGIAKYNPQYATKSNAPVSATAAFSQQGTANASPIGDDEDPFADPEEQQPAAESL
jgi:hypothetical protein